MPQTDVDVVVLTWNDPPLMLEAAVDSALASEGVHARVIVVDNGSEPAVAVSDDRCVTLLRSPRNLGVSVGRTVGVMSGAAPVVAFLDSDARLTPGALSRLVSAVNDEGVGVAGPGYAGQDPSESGGRAPTLRTKAQRALNLRSTYDGGKAVASHSSPVRDVDFVIGACQVFRRDVWDAVGGLDTSIFYGPEDVDFCLRVRQLGLRVIQVLDAEAHHPPRRAAKNLLSARGARHALAVARHLWRHRRYRSPEAG